MSAARYCSNQVNIETLQIAVFKVLEI